MESGLPWALCDGFLQKPEIAIDTIVLCSESVFKPRKGFLQFIHVASFPLVSYPLRKMNSGRVESLATSIELLMATSR